MTYDDGYQMITRFFTFGAEHTLPDGMYAGDKTVMVEAPEDVDRSARQASVRTPPGSCEPA